MNDPAASSGVSSSLLGRHSVLDTACPVLDTGESSRVFWIPAFAGMTNSPQAAGNTTLREFKWSTHKGLGAFCSSLFFMVFLIISTDENNSFLTGGRN